MSYFTTNTYQLKREIVNFSKKICKNSNKPTSKFVTDMLYGISKSKDILLSSISEALDEIIHKHYAQKIEETNGPDDALKIKEEIEELSKLLESKKQEAKEFEQAKTDAKETLDKLFGNLNEKE